MKHKKFLLIALICLIGIGISFLLFSAHRPFKDLEAADITSASVRLSPPDTTIQIVETEELVSYLNEVVIYNKDNSYTEYAGQAVIFTRQRKKPNKLRKPPRVKMVCTVPPPVWN